MEDAPKQPPYEENDESFGKWFRVAAEEKWKNYLGGNERGISGIERDTMRKFLIEHGTQEEIQAKLDSFGFNMLADKALREDVKSLRPNIELE